MITKKKNLKPIELDINCKYRCPNIECGYFHWISLKEAKTKNFKIVCDCGTIFKPKQISNVQIIYIEDKINNENNSVDISANKIVKANTDTDYITDIVKVIVIPESTKNKSIKLLIDYGFTESESELFVEKAYGKLQDSNPVSLVKYIMQNLEEFDE
jgi:hypothetical protein